MGALPATNQWVRLEVPASLVDLEGRVINGGAFYIFDGVCSFDASGKYPGRLQLAEAVINIPPLQTLGDPVRTFQPGQIARLQANYDDAQTLDLAAWSILSGLGTLNGNQFTAQTRPGTTVIRATSGEQVADLTINVPAIITPNFGAAAPLEQIDWETNLPDKPGFRSAGTLVEGTGNVTPGLPPGLQEGDTMLLYAEDANETVPTPAGWALPPNSPQGTGTAAGAAATRLTAFWKRAVAGEVAPLVTDPGEHIVAQILAYKDCIVSGNPWDITVGNVQASAVTGVSMPGGTTTAPKTIIVQAVSFATDIGTPQVSGYANPDLVNLTERVNVASTQGNGGGFAVVDGEKAVAGPFAATTATLANASVQGRITIALRPNVVVWSSVPAGINASTGVWTFPNDIGRKVRIAVSDGVFTAQRDLLILGKFPITRIATPVDGERSKKVLISEAEDGTDVSRVKSGTRDSYSVRITLLTLAELNSVLAFWDEYHPGKRFIFEDIPRQIRKIVKFDSDMKWEGYAGRFNVAFRVKEVAAQ
jgi:hypothetical protein